MSNYILCLDTATKNCSVAIYKDDELVICIEETSEAYIHSEKLALFIEDAFQKAGIVPSELSAVAISSGPGSYTGLRIGVATAKGICVGAGVPLISIPNLEQLATTAEKAHPEYSHYIPMLDARRMEVYCAVYKRNSGVIVPVHAKEIDSSSFLNLTESKIAVLGDGAEKCLETLNNLNVELLSIRCSARNMGNLAFQKLKENNIEDIAYFEPFYLKEFIAGTPKKLI